MENRKLLNFLLNDLSELEEIFREKGQSGFDELEMEFIESRLTGMKRLLSRLNQQKGSSQVSNAQETKRSHTSSEEKQDNTSISSSTPSQKTETTTQLEVEKNNRTQDIEGPQPEPSHSSCRGPEQSAPQLETLVQEAPPTKEKKRLADSFEKSASLNERVAIKNKLEQKLSNSPLRSLKAGIGINDRYLFIRELFKGDADAFLHTIELLDRMNDLQEATDFLKGNFHWEESDACLQFMNLVKRRFAHESK